MPSTTHGLPYPSGSSPANVPGDMQALADAVDTAILTASLDAWTSYVPAWTGATTNPVIGNGTIVGAYRQVGKTVNFRIVITMGASTTYGSGIYSVTLPPVTAVDARVIHPGTIRTSVTWPLFAAQTSTSTLGLLVLPTTAGNQFAGMAQGTPVTLADTHVIVISGTYEAA